MDTEQTRVWGCFIPVVMPFHINQIKPSPSLAAFFVSFHYPSWPSHTETTVSVQSVSVQPQQTSTSTFWFMDLIQAKYICALYIFIASEIDESVCMCHCNLRENVKMLNICQREKKTKQKSLRSWRAWTLTNDPTHPECTKVLGGVYGAHTIILQVAAKDVTCIMMLPGFRFRHVLHLFTLYTSHLSSGDTTSPWQGEKVSFYIVQKKKLCDFEFPVVVFFVFFLFQRPSKSMSRVFKRLHEVKLNLHDVLS